MREGRLAGSWPGAAPDDCGRRRAVVRSPERRREDERMLRREEPGDRVDPRDLERLLGCERREDSR